MLTLSQNPVARMQALFTGFQHGANQLVAVGSTLYFVILEQIGSAPANDLRVYKSTDKVTWTLAATYVAFGPPLQTNAAQDCPCIVVGTTIYIVGTQINSSVSPAVVRLLIHRYDTLTDTFLTDSTPSASMGGAGQQLWSISAFNDADSLLVSTTVALPAGVPIPRFNTYIYSIAGNSWNAGTTIVVDSSQVISQIHEPVNDVVYVFYQKAATTELRCALIDTTGAVVIDVTVVNIAAGGFPIGDVGMPIVSVSTGEIVIPYRVRVGMPTLQAARTPIGLLPVFTNDVVEDDSTLGGFWPQAYDQIAGPGWFAQEIAGLLYVFYIVDNGDLDSALSQSYLYYRTSTGPGVWSAPLIAFTSALSREMGIPYGTSAIAGFDPVILLTLFDPTLWPAITSLSDIVLFPAAAPAPIFPTVINVQSLYVVCLPDPSKSC